MSDALTFKLGGLVVPIYAALDFDQTYETIGGADLLRMADGSSMRQRAWRRLRTRLSGAGWSPIGINALDWDSPLTLECGMPLALDGYTGALPANRTGKYAPRYFDVLDNGLLVATGAAPVGRTVVSTRVEFFPILTVWASPPKVSGTRGNYTWEIDCEEV